MEGKNSAFVIEYRLCNKQGDYRWIECRGLSQLDIEGNPVRLAGSHTDITERKQAYTELQKMTKELATKAAELDLSNKELEQFAYIASHDLKAPLRAIANLSQWIEEDLDEAMTDDTRKQMTLLRSRVLRMEGLINGVLQYSRVGRIDTEIETVDVTQLLDEVLDGLDPPAGFHIDIDPDMPVLQTARVPLSQIFSNLLSNAIKYHDRPESAQITVSVRSLNDVSYEFTVADDGPGIAPEYHNKVFQIFQTLNARDTVESTGVGLTVVKKIVEQLKIGKRSERLVHRQVYRPWGSYEGVDAGERFQVKRIVVKLGAALSLQMHHHRAEHWIVVAGTARVTCGEREFLLSENQSTYIPVGAKHRLENTGSIPLEMIEVQSGSYFGEDDIVRYEDKYGRIK